MLAEGRPHGQRSSALCSWRAPGARPGPGPEAPWATYPRLLGSNPSHFTWTGWPKCRRSVRAAYAMLLRALRKPQHRRTFPPRWSAGLQSAARKIAAQTQTSPRVSPRGQCSGPSSPTSPEASRPSARSVGLRHPETSPVPLRCRRTLRLRQTQESRRSEGTPTPPPGALGLTPFSPTSETGYLVHALQTTLWTFSLLFKSPPGEGGKKNPEEIRVNWKEKKVQKGVHSSEKGDLLILYFFWSN